MFLLSQLLTPHPNTVHSQWGERYSTSVFLLISYQMPFNLLQVRVKGVCGGNLPGIHKSCDVGKIYGGEYSSSAPRASNSSFTRNAPACVPWSHSVLWSHSVPRLFVVDVINGSRYFSCQTNSILCRERENSSSFHSWNSIIMETVFSSLLFLALQLWLLFV